MIHLTKSKTGYMVVTLADNGEVLATSEVLTSRANAIKNIGSQSCQFSSGNFIFQDDTGKKPVVYGWEDMENKPVKTEIKPEKKYKAK